MRIILATLMAFLLVSCGETVNETTTHSSTANQETFEWKLVTTWPKNYPGLGLAPENFAVVRETGADGYPQSEVMGDRESDVEDCEAPLSHGATFKVGDGMTVDRHCFLL